MIDRAVVYDVIDGERAYQDRGAGNAKRHENQPPVMTPGEYLLCMEEVFEQARAAWYKPDGSRVCLESVRKIAALGVACMEHHGAPPRQ